MEWQVILALVVGITICLLPGIMAWYFNFGGTMAAVRKRRAAREAKTVNKAAAGKTL